MKACDGRLSILSRFGMDTAGRYWLVCLSVLHWLLCLSIQQNGRLVSQSDHTPTATRRA